MKLVFIDESGYSQNWIADIAAQPFYVLSAVCIDSGAYPQACADIQREVANLNLPGLSHPLGEGAEIKAREIAHGEGWW